MIDWQQAHINAEQEMILFNDIMESVERYNRFIAETREQFPVDKYPVLRWTGDYK